jgi:hypothetical protein
MSRRSSPRKKAISPVTIVDSDDDFLAVASDEEYLVFLPLYLANFSDFLSLL